MTHTDKYTLKRVQSNRALNMELHACMRVSMKFGTVFLWSIRRFVFAIIPCQQHLGRQTIAEKIGSQTPFTVSLAGQCASSRLHTHTHTRSAVHVQPCNKHTHRKHKCPAEMYVTHTIYRLSSKSCGAVLKDTAVWHVLSLFSLWHSLSASLTLSRLLLGCRTLPQQTQVCRCRSPLLFFLPFPSLPFPLLSSFLSVCSWEAELIL